MPEPEIPDSKQELIPVWEIHIKDDPTGPHYFEPGKPGCLRHSSRTRDCRLIRDMRYPVTCDTCEGPLAFKLSPQGHFAPCPLCKRVSCDHTLSQRGDGVCPGCPEDTGG